MRLSLLPRPRRFCQTLQPLSSTQGRFHYIIPAPDSPTESRALGLSRVSRSTVGEIRWLRTLGAARVPSLRAASLRIARRSDPNPGMLPSSTSARAL